MALGMRKLISGQKEVEMLLDDCGQIGVDVIELQWIKDFPVETERVAIGFDVPKIKIGRNKKNAAKLDYNVEWINGEVVFNPDERGNAWGYVALTDFNRDVLAQSIPAKWWTIVDMNIRSRIVEHAFKKGYKTSYDDDPSNFTDHVKDDPKKLKEEIARLKAQLQDNGVVNDDKVDELAVKETKPLSGIKISDKKRAEHSKRDVVARYSGRAVKQ